MAVIALHPVHALVFAVVSGAVCAWIASTKGRSVVGWFFIGCVTGVVGIVLAVVASNERETREIRARDSADRRRLREQLRQEQIKNEAFQRHTMTRLDTHDRALEMDTRQAPELATPGISPLLAGGHPPPVAQEAAWHYAENGRSVGPVPESTLRTLLRQGDLDANTLVWREGQQAWLPVRSVATFEDEVAS